MNKCWFVAGTDTGVGKTLVSAALLQAANQRGLRTLGLKPLAAGCEDTETGLHNDDALLLQHTASVALSYEQVNPVALREAVAPHLAAGMRQLSADRLAAYCRGSLLQAHDFAVIEGAGGWRVPLNYRETLARLPQLLELPVILVVGMRLGCLNHALLSAEAIRHDGLRLAGWVACQVDAQMPLLDENIATLERLLPAPLLGRIPWMEAVNVFDAAAQLDLNYLLGKG